jgi:hypothetical protein
MKTGHRLALTLALAVLPVLARAADKSPVVVELFTSQGCSSCPPADAYLGELAKRPDLLALAFHVEYWNYIGWVDPFAKPWATRRQHDYMSKLHTRYIFTPEIVVNGATEGIGSERNAIEPLIHAAAMDTAPHPELTLLWRADGALVVDVGEGHSPPDEPAVLWLLGYDGLHETKVLRGENEGQTLADHHAVRSFRKLGAWLGWSEQLIVPADEARTLGDSGIAVLLQAAGSGPIISAAQIDQRR